MSTATLDMQLTARDVSGQRAFSVKRLAAESSVGELVRRLVGKLGLANQDSSGRPTVYRAYLEREGRHLHGSELVADSLRTQDSLVIQPDIQAG
jgi:hypothetical protein